MNEPLDFCRVKKIDEKGFGFLKSLYYQRDIFFHFSQIKKEDFKEKLTQLKRGEFFLFFQSKELPDGKRKAARIWYSLQEVPQELLEDFKNRIIKEFDDGSVNLFDLIYVYSELKKLKMISLEDSEKILKSKKVSSLPTTIIDYLNEDEKETFKKILNLNELAFADKKPFWYDDVITKL